MEFWKEFCDFCEKFTFSLGSFFFFDKCVGPRKCPVQISTPQKLSFLNKQTGHYNWPFTVFTKEINKKS